MPPNGLNGKEARFFSITMGVLVILITLLSGFLLVQNHAQSRRIDQQEELIRSFPETYVRLERYSCDMDDLKVWMANMNDKLDRLIERGK